jgi:hypothetical protein
MAKQDDPGSKHPRDGADSAYCEFRNDRERRNALISRDVRMVLCRMLTIAGIVAVALLSPGAVGLLTRLRTLL